MQLVKFPALPVSKTPAVPFAAAASFLLLFLAVGCGQAIVPAPEPFHHQADIGEGRRISLSGESGWYAFGSPFHLTVGLANESSEPWDGVYCLLLVNEEGIVARLVERPVGLAPGEAATDAVETHAPANVPPRPYGVLLLVPGEEPIAETIYIAGADGPDGPWGAGVDECRSGPVPPPGADIERTPGFPDAG